MAENYVKNGCRFKRLLSDFLDSMLYLEHKLTISTYAITYQ